MSDASRMRRVPAAVPDRAAVADCVAASGHRRYVGPAEAAAPGRWSGEAAFVPLLALRAVRVRLGARPPDEVAAAR